MCLYIIYMLSVRCLINSQLCLRNSLKACQRKDERETRRATSLIALASVACASGVLQGRALSAMLQLTINREVKTQKVQKVLSAAMQQTMYTSLIEDNLSYLLTSWLDAKYPLQKFPWTLTGNDRLNFQTKNRNTMRTILQTTRGYQQVARPQLNSSRDT